jgi:hypothetical protein
LVALLDVSSFRDATLMPSEDVDALEAMYPAYLRKRIEIREGWMNARLTKRYAVPFSPASPPSVAVGWLVAMVTLDAYLKRGFNPESKQDALIEAAELSARTEILEAANDETGLFDLPLRADAPGASGVTKGGGLGYSEASPYVWTGVQARRARDDDARGEGS